MPMAIMVVTRADPPAETMGSGRPITGKRPMTAPMLIIACSRIHAMIPAVAICTNESRDRDTIRRHAPGDHREEQEQGEGAGQAELLPDDGEDEVVVRRGEPRPLLLTGPEAHPPPPAVGQRVEAVDGLPAHPVRVLYMTR